MRRRRFSDCTVDYTAAIKSSQRPSISFAYRFSFALIAYYDSIAACVIRTWRGATAGTFAQNGKCNEHSSSRIETRIDAISRLFARTRSKWISARHTISSAKSAEGWGKDSCIEDDAIRLSIFDSARASFLKEQRPNSSHTATRVSPSTRPQLYETCSKAP